jgi:GNAT superfamily N-acetyltransferase
MNNQEKPGIVRLSREHFDEVVSTLCAAFHDYPVMRYVLKDAGAEYDARLNQLVGYFTDSRVCRGWPVLGLVQRGELLAAANINPPQPAPPPASLQQRYDRLHDDLGEAAMTRFEAFSAAAAPFAPDEPHYYLGMIGVPPEHQGRGYARLLLNAVHEMSAQDPDSCGVVLTTETQKNVPLYEHFGYRVLGSGKVEELTTWVMFRPDSSG